MGSFSALLIAATVAGAAAAAYRSFGADFVRRQRDLRQARKAAADKNNRRIIDLKRDPETGVFQQPE